MFVSTGLIHRSIDMMTIMHCTLKTTNYKKVTEKTEELHTHTNQQGISEDRFTEFILGNRACTRTIIIRSDIKKQCLSGRLEEPSVYHVDGLRLSKKKKKTSHTSACIGV